MASTAIERCFIVLQSVLVLLALALMSEIDNDPAFTLIHLWPRLLCLQESTSEGGTDGETQLAGRWIAAL